MTGKQLKNSILQWAIQGKLVPQDPNDEPASVLLEKIRAEKARLVKEGKIKKDKKESIIYRGDDNSHYEKILATGEVKCIDDELPYSLPHGWTWCRLNELGIYRKGPFGSSLTKSMFVPKSEHSIKVYEQKNAIQKDYRLGDYYISEDKFSEMQSFVTKPSDIIVSCAGTIGETYLLPEEAPIGIINQALMRVELYNLDIADYWQLFFAYILLIENKMKGAGSAIKNIPPFEYLKAILVPIPPLQEQKRIIEKYNELTKLIYQYIQQKELLDLLNDNLYSNIKKSILQEAIQGKLVPQDPADEPASVLLEHIKEEKLRLVKEGKLKKKDVVDSVIFKGDDNRYFEKIGKKVTCIDEDIPFEIPSGWVWCRINHIAISQLGKTLDKGKAEGKEYPYLCSINVQWDGINLSKVKTFLLKDDELERYKLNKGDLLVCEGGDYGRCSIWNSNAEMYYQNALHRIRFFGNISALFYKYVFEIYRSIGYVDGQGQTIKHFTYENMKSLLFPLPPIGEQLRIVIKIDEALAGIMSR